MSMNLQQLTLNHFLGGYECYVDYLKYNQTTDKQLNLQDEIVHRSLVL